MVKRPPLALRGQAKGIRQSSASLRLSFGQGEGPAAVAEETDGGDASGESAVFTPKKSRLSRQLLERSRSATPLPLPLPLPATARSGASNNNNDDRPSYSKEYLNELRSGTPSTPKDLSVVRAAGGGVVDVAAKFGPQASWHAADNPAIPSEAEIREKKERRARLAREQQAYISLDAEEDGGGEDGDEEAQEEEEGTRRATRSRAFAEDAESDDDYGIAVQRRRPQQQQQQQSLHDKWGETRLVRDDEDIAEGFDEFVDDGRIALGRAAERKRKQQEREAIRGLIEEAEGGGGGGDGNGSNVTDDDDDESEAERRAAYEEAQTRAGAYQSSSLASRTNREPRHARSGTPPKITPIPTLKECVARLERTLRAKEERQALKTQQLQEIARRRLEALDRRAEIQRLLEEAGQKYDKLRAEAGMEGGFHYASSDGGARSGSGYATPNQPDQQRLLPIRLPVERGLESFGDIQTPPAYP